MPNVVINPNIHLSIDQYRLGLAGSSLHLGSGGGWAGGSRQRPTQRPAHHSSASRSSSFLHPTLKRPGTRRWPPLRHPPPPSDPPPIHPLHINISLENIDTRFMADLTRLDTQIHRNPTPSSSTTTRPPSLLPPSSSTASSSSTCTFAYNLYSLHPYIRL